jgi:hypothetical protein
MPEIHFTRDTYSESLGLLAVWIGLTLFARLRHTRSIWPAALVGLVFGASMVSRIDAFLGFIAVAAFAVILTAASPEMPRWRGLARAVSLLVAVFVAFFIGLYDLDDHSGSYAATSRPQLTQVVHIDAAVAVLAVLIVAIAWFGRPLLRSAIAHREVLGTGAAVLVAVVFAGLAARPLFEVSHGPDNPSAAVVGHIQQSIGASFDPTRLYTENSVSWMAYYLGPVTVVLGIVGLCVLVRRTLAGGQLDLLAPLALVVPVAVGYFLRPNITPDQIWAARRYLPVVIPGLLIGTAVILEAAVAASAGPRARLRSTWVRPVGFGLVGIVAAATLAVPLVISKPLIRVREYTHDLTLVQRLCQAAGPRGELLALDSASGPFHGVYVAPLQAYCNVPIASTIQPTQAGLADAAAAAAHSGRTLTVFALNASVIGPVSSAPLPAVPSLTVLTRDWRPELTRAPYVIRDLRTSLYVGRVNADGSVSVTAGTGGLTTTFR